MTSSFVILAFALGFICGVGVVLPMVLHKTEEEINKYSLLVDDGHSDGYTYSIYEEHGKTRVFRVLFNGINIQHKDKQFDELPAAQRFVASLISKEREM